jgi:hypothetical protein
MKSLYVAQQKVKKIPRFHQCSIRESDCRIERQIPFSAPCTAKNPGFCQVAAPVAYISANEFRKIFIKPRHKMTQYFEYITKGHVFRREYTDPRKLAEQFVRKHPSGMFLAVNYVILSGSTIPPARTMRSGEE